MEDVYGLKPMEDVVRVGEVSSASELHPGPVVNHCLQPQPAQLKRSGSDSDTSDQFIKTRIANHPLYPNLLSAYIECQKVGASPELASLLDEMARENHPITARPLIGDDPELDHFMESYCQVLRRCKEELCRPFNEATLFLSNIESQLSNLCKGTLAKPSGSEVSDEAGVTSEEELSCGEVEGGEGPGSFGTCQGDQEIKGMLLRKYSGYLSNLRKEFLKKRKKGKLPKDARMALLNWWNAHYRWPYPTEEEKQKLAEMSGLSQKQINNWFINQRKRHWKPSEDMRFAILGGVSGVSTFGGPLYFDSPPPPQPQPR